MYIQFVLRRWQTGVQTGAAGRAGRGSRGGRASGDVPGGAWDVAGDVGGPAADAVWRRGRKPTTAGEGRHAIIELWQWDAEVPAGNWGSACDITGQATRGI